MTKLSPNAQSVSNVFEEVSKGNGTPFWEACHDDMVWRTIGQGSWSGEFVGKQTIIDEIFRHKGKVETREVGAPSTSNSSSGGIACRNRCERLGPIRFGRFIKNHQEACSCAPGPTSAP